MFVCVCCFDVCVYVRACVRERLRERVYEHVCECVCVCSRARSSSARFCSETEQGGGWRVGGGGKGAVSIFAFVAVTFPTLLTRHNSVTLKSYEGHRNQREWGL